MNLKRFALAFAMVAAAPRAPAGETSAPSEAAAPGEPAGQKPTEEELARKREGGPELAVQPDSITVAAKSGEAAVLPLTVRNAGGGKLAWLVLSAPEWVSPGALSGELGPGEERKLLLTVKPPEPATEGEIVIVAARAKGSPAKFRILPVPLFAPEGGAVEGAVVVRIEPVVEIPPLPGEIPAAPALTRRGRAGVRAGVLLPGGGETRDYGASALVGLAWASGRSEEEKLSYEVGLDFGRAQASDGKISSTLKVARINFLYTPGPSEGGYYLLAGLGGVAVTVGDAPYLSLGGASLAGAVDIGAGVNLAGGRFDVRLTESVLLGSTNVKALTLVTLCVNF